MLIGSFKELNMPVEHSRDSRHRCVPTLPSLWDTSAHMKAECQIIDDSRVQKIVDWLICQNLTEV